MRIIDMGLLKIITSDYASENAEQQSRTPRDLPQYYWRRIGGTRHVLVGNRPTPSLTYSFTGYWMPFEAAKAVAATFCYHIRYALTPLFGLDFVSKCLKPGEDRFGHMVIDRQIVRRCTDEANGYRSTSRESSRVASPTTPVSPSNMSKWTPRPLRPRLTGLFDSESGYYSDTDRSDKYLASPQSISPKPAFSWTAMNTPRSVNQEPELPFPQAIVNNSYSGRGCEAPPNSPDSSHSSRVPQPTQGSGEVEEEDYDEAVSPRSIKVGLLLEKRRRAAMSTKDTRAAYLLMQLHFADATLKDGTKKRRASS